MSTTPDLVSLFSENAARADASIHRLKDKEKIQDKVKRLLAEGADVYCRKATKLEKAAVGRMPNVVEDYKLAAVTIEEVSAAIAETGSIVCDSSEGRSLQSSLLPLHHVAIIPHERIFATFDEYFASRSDLPANITFITGPSRTADIELELAIGVHGPEKLDIIIV